MTLYIRANAMTEIAYIAPLLRAVLELTLHRLEGAPRQFESRRRELLWLLNECPRLGYMELIEQAPAEVRSYKMRFLIVCQDISQLFRAFGHDTPLLANCKTHVFAGTQHDDTVAMLSRRLDMTTVQWQSRTRSRTGGSVVQHQGARRLLTESEIRGLADDILLIWAEGCGAPLLAKKLRYYTDHF